MPLPLLDPIIVACPSCAAPNRVPRDRLGAGRCGRCKAALFAGEPITLTAATFDRHAATSDLPLLVDFWAAWCGPCRQMAPIFAQAAMALEPHFRLGKLDTGIETSLAARFAVQAIPTLLVVHKGRELARRDGVMPLQTLTSWARQAAKV